MPEKRGYQISMVSKCPSETEFRLSFEEAAHLQVLAGDPLDEEEISMFRMFDRESWSDEKRRRYILDRTLSRSGETG